MQEVDEITEPFQAEALNTENKIIVKKDIAGPVEKWWIVVVFVSRSSDTQAFIGVEERLAFGVACTEIPIELSILPLNVGDLRLLLHAGRVAVRDIGLQYFKFISDNEMGLAFPFGTVGGAAPAVSITPGLQMFVERKVIKAKVDASVWPKVEFNCRQK
ncbi:unnamed protein product [Leptosia nina]|uniref:Uncharacterized protein n=1 Tax=Leptosia nina TaxID=320188 RepID=A0AAV1J7A7_9NEOP